MVERGSAGREEVREAPLKREIGAPAEPGLKGRDERLTRARRIKTRGEFLKIQSSGKKFRSLSFLLLVAPAGAASSTSISGRRELEEGVQGDKRHSKRLTEKAPDSRESRIGITITKKVHKRAVKRNKLRRRIREIFRKLRPELTTPSDLVVIALAGSVTLSFEQVRSELVWLLKKARLVASDL